MKTLWRKKTWVGLGLGQILSLLITSTGFSSSELAKQVIFSDVHAGDRAGGSNPIKGDALVIAGATLYAVSNVSEEFLVKNAGRVELMAMLGIFGSIISGIQISIVERNALKSIHWTPKAAVPFVGFSVAMFFFYSLVPVLLQINGAAMLNLSLLTSDMWAVVIRVFAYHEKVDWIYFVAFAAVVVGLILYSVGDKEVEVGQTAIANDAVDEEGGSRSHTIDERIMVTEGSSKPRVI